MVEVQSARHPGTREEAIEAIKDTFQRQGRPPIHTFGCEADFVGIGVGWTPCQCEERMAVFLINAVGWRPEHVVKTEALLEAANEWQVKGWAEHVPPAGASRIQLILGMAQRATEFLRERAKADG